MMLDSDELRRTMRHIEQIAGLETDPVKVGELQYLASIYHEELRDAEETGGGCDPRLVALLPSV